LKKRVNLKGKTAKLALASTFFPLMLIFIEKINERNAGRVTDVWIRAAAAYKVREKNWVGSGGGAYRNQDTID